MNEIVDKKVREQVQKDMTAKAIPAVVTPEPAPEAAPEPPVKEAEEVMDIKNYVPKKWREKVDEVLGKDFKLEIEESSGGNFILKVFVPEEYDCRVGDERSMNKQDMRCGLIRRASDVADVEKWCNLIKANIQKTHSNFKQ